ncbi:hypothetical protein [Amycolatopsis sp. NPDC051128]|uniref:hypothetical protein n=1 Tax=Amycolatopsis sp. NPDC051128 TaxID=3155412 RepID=UPI0034330557
MTSITLPPAWFTSHERDVLGDGRGDDGGDGAPAPDDPQPVKALARITHGGVHNQVTGNVTREVVQAGDVHGNISL